MLNEAVLFARECHKGQTRKTGEAYINHPKNVAGIVFVVKNSKNIEQLMSACMLHDVVEDCGVSINEIRIKFGDMVASLVSELTSSDSDRAKFNSKAEYLYDKMIRMTDYALVIKLADRLDNVSGLQNCNASFRKKYVKETEYIIDGLKANRKNITNTQYRLIDQIQLMLGNYLELKKINVDDSNV